jgi:pimeloyl-ACP methyl ester carboxylesterase
MSDPPIHERRITLAGFGTRVLEVPGDGPPILLLHGFSDSADSWRPLLVSLAARSRRAVAIDVPGFGAATRLPRGSLLPHLDAFTSAFVGAYGQDEPAVLAGNSMGGLLALRAAQRGDVPLLAVVGVGPAGLSYSAGLTRAVNGARVLRPVLRTIRYLLVPPRLLQLTLAHLYDAGMGRHSVDPSLAGRYASHYRGMRDVYRLIPVMLALSDESDDDPLDLGEISVPVTVILGARDRLVPVSAARILLEALPNAQLAVLEDCGHCPQLQRPDDVADVLAALRSPVPSA